MVTTHSLGIQDPQPYDIKVGQIVINPQTLKVFTKDLDGKINQVNLGATRFEDLEDVDLTNAKEGSFFVKNGTKYIATNFIGSIDKLENVEINDPQTGEYLRYDATYQAFRNTPVTYSVHELTDVDLTGLQNDKTLFYDATSGKFKLRNRINTLNELLDVLIVPNEDVPTLLTFDPADSKWKNLPLKVERDTAPRLSANLDANYRTIYNSSYRVNTLTITDPIHTIDYANGDYWIITGSSVNTVVNINISPSDNCTQIMLLELRQGTGQILLGNLTNVYYEDGRPLSLSGPGKTDIITVTSVHSGTLRNYVTANALNVALSGQGGSLSNRYDKSRYPEIQIYNTPSLYDDYFDYVTLLLNFEPEQTTSKLWYEDKSDYISTVVTTATQEPTDIYTFGIRDYVAKFDDDTLTVTYDTPVDLEDFTIEFFINYPTNSFYIDNPVHTYFSTDNITFGYEYDNFTLTIEATTYTLPNGFRAFAYQNNRYIHIALVRTGSTVKLYIDGTLYTPTYTYATIVPVDTLTISLSGNVNSFRITKLPRYLANFLPPAPRFGLVGGASDILENIVNGTQHILGIRELEDELFL